MQVIIQQEQNARGKAEQELERVREREQVANEAVKALEQELREVRGKLEGLTREFDMAESKLLEMQVRMRKFKADKKQLDK